MAISSALLSERVGTAVTAPDHKRTVLSALQLIAIEEISELAPRIVICVLNSGGLFTNWRVLRHGRNNDRLDYLGLARKDKAKSPEDKRDDRLHYLSL